MKNTKLPTPKIGDLWCLKSRSNIIVMVTGFVEIWNEAFVRFLMLKSGNEGTEPASMFNWFYVPLVSETEKKVEKNT
jgi:hypothetical protein